MIGWPLTHSLFTVNDVDEMMMMTDVMNTGGGMMNWIDIDDAHMMIVM